MDAALVYTLAAAEAPQRGELLAIIIIATIIIIAAAAAVYFSMQTQPGGIDGNPLGAEDEFQIPRADFDAALPVVYGRWKLAPQYIWAPNARVPEFGWGTTPTGWNLRWFWTRDARRDRTTRAYRGSALFVLCEQADEVTEVWRAEDRIWTGTTTPLSNIGSPTPVVMLGEVGRLNGTSSGPDELFVFFGGQSQADLESAAARAGFNWQIRNQQGVNVFERLRRDDQPDMILYRHCVTVYMDDCFLGDNARSFPNWTIAVGRYTFAGSLDPAKARIGDDANAAHVVYDLLTVHQGMPSGRIDIASFEAVQDTLFAEGLGISIGIVEPTEVDRIIEDVAATVDGFVYTDTATGLLKFKLVRDDYDPDTIPHLTRDELRDVILAVPDWEATLTEYTISWTDPAIGWKLTSRRVENAANLSMLGRRTSKDFEYPMLTTEAAARQVNARLYARKFYPLRLLSAKVHRQVADIRVGDVFKWSDSRLNITGAIFRVTRCESGGEADDVLELTCEEDIFSIGIGAPPAFPDIDYTPVDYAIAAAPSPVVVMDAPRGSTIGRDAIVLAGPPDSGVATRILVAINGNPVGDVVVTPVAELVTPLSAGDYWIADVLTVENAEGWAEVDHTSEAWQVSATLALIEDGGTDIELVSIQTLEDDGGGDWTARGLIRGIGGSPLAWSAGARVWLVRPGAVGPSGIGLPAQPAPDINDPLAAILTTHGISAALAIAAPVDVTCRAANDFAVGPASAPVSYQYGFGPQQPLAPTGLNYIGGSTHRLFWDVRTRTAFVGSDPAGAMPFDADLIVAGISGAWDGVFRIYKNGTLVGSTFDRDWEVPAPRNGDYVVRHEVDGFLSPASNTVTIP